jgi:hypothetical protein
MLGSQSLFGGVIAIARDSVTDSASTIGPSVFGNAKVASLASPHVFGRGISLG